jgi:hypothetical protein
VSNDPLRLTWVRWQANERPAGSAYQRSRRPVLQLCRGTEIDATELYRLTAGNPFLH